MPTASASASSVIMLSVKPSDHHQAERRDDRHRDRDRGDDRRAQAAEEQQHDERGEHGADHEVLEHLRRPRSGSGSSCRGRRRPSSPPAAASAARSTCVQDRIDDGDRVGAGLLADRERDRGDPVAHRRGLGVLLGVVDDRRRRRGRRDRVVARSGGRRCRRSDPARSWIGARPRCAASLLRRAGLDLAAGDVDVAVVIAR